MVYHFEYDEKVRGDVRFRREAFAVLHDAHETLLADIRTWASRAKAVGVSGNPYSDVIEILEGMTEWGREQLTGTNTLSITAHRVKVGALSLDKAALEYAALKADQEAAEKSKGMPSAIAEALGEKGRMLRAEASRIDAPAAGILDELRPHLDALLKPEA